ncbi:cytochrome P450 1B1-like [Lethenteron reissneri]|uniref:cytochrome P450 1B1-like n=1 Tax=Lethenteron reissneri TaxID=7753 RepID=UPI002AB78F34|nr:cytochrome P450 1B1-like [Lethenteron reissneri]
MTAAESMEALPVVAAGSGAQLWDISHPPVLFFLLSALLILLVTLEARKHGRSHQQKQQQQQQQKNSAPDPPGPFAFPIVGNSLQLGPMPHLTLTAMAQRYGPVFRIHLGHEPVVVLTGEEIIREALVKRGTEFAGRPDFPSFALVSGGNSMSFTNYSELWRMHRRLAHSTLRAFFTGTAATRRVFEGHVRLEAAELCAMLAAATSRAGGGVVDPSEPTVLAVANVISAVCFGKRYEHDDAELRDLLSNNERFSKTVGAGSVVDVMPWLMRFPNPVRSIYRDFEQMNNEFFAFVQRKVQEHRDSYDPAATPRDMIDALIGHIEGGGGDSDEEGDAADGAGAAAGGAAGGAGGGAREEPLKLGPQYVDSTLTDVFGAGQDTMSTSLLWFVLLCAKHPDLQADMQRDIDRVVGRERLPRLDDRPQLACVDAFVCEMMRHVSYVPFTIPHATTTDTELNGYRIAKGTVVFVNQWSVNHDPAIWRDPERFDPSRFLDETGAALDRDIARRVMIFSSGKRRCIGYEMAKMQLFLFCSVLLHQLSMSVPPGHVVSLEGVYGLSLKPKHISVAFTPREQLLGRPGEAEE